MHELLQRAQGSGRWHLEMGGKPDKNQCLSVRGWPLCVSSGKPRRNRAREDTGTKATML